MRCPGRVACARTQCVPANMASARVHLRRSSPCRGVLASATVGRPPGGRGGERLVTALLQLRDAIEDGGHFYLFSILVGPHLVGLAGQGHPLPAVRPVDTGVPDVPRVWSSRWWTSPSISFRDVLSRIVRQSPTEVLVVINGPRNRDLEGVCVEFPLVQWEWTAVAGKRNALRVGIEKLAVTWLCSSTATPCGPRERSESS